MSLQDELDAIPRPPWPADWQCRDVDCGHARSAHREPLVEDGRCGVTACRCWGWSPLTDAQWVTVYAAQRAGLVSSEPRG